MPTPSPLAFSPGSVTCFFRPVWSTDPAQTCSQGLGINVVQGVTASLTSATSHAMFWNGKPTEIACVHQVVRELAPEPIAIHFESPLPLGCGFGISAGCALSAAFALAKKYDHPHDRFALGMIAHRAEVAQRTGLGDVCSQLCGGVAYRHCTNNPLDADRLAIADRPLFFRVFGDLRTVKILTSPELMNRIQAEGDRAMTWLSSVKDSVSLEQILDRSLEFDRNAGLLTDRDVASSIEDMARHGGHGSMILLGRSVLSTIPGIPASAWTESAIDLLGTRWL